MKKYQFIITIFGLFALAACQKLDREFVTTASREQIEQSYANVKSELTAIYSDLPDGLLYIDGSAMMASASDEAEFTNDGSSIQAFNTGSWNAISNPDYIWDKYFRSVRKVNQFLLSTGKINLDQYKLDPAASAQLVYANNLAEIKRWGYEARFLRAYFYFELVKRFGGVPLLKTALAITDDFTKTERNSLNDCINFITSECDSAAIQLPYSAASTTTPNFAIANDLGRATKLAALALKSRVLLYAASDLFNTVSWAGGYAKTELISLPTSDRTARWKAAADAAKAVIDTAAFYGVAVNVNFSTAYKTIFNTANNAEIILARTNASGGNANTFERTNSPIGFPSGLSGNTPSQDLVDAYEVKQSATVSVPFDWNNPAMAAKPYANRDPRLGITVVWNDTTFGTITSATRSNRVQLFTGGLDGKPVTNASKTGYYLRKYQVESLNILSGNTASHSWIYFRFPEIYLNYAEALNEWSPGHPDIIKYINFIRQRSGVAMPPLVAGLSQADMRAKIRNERRVELAFEDHRFWDVRRWMQGETYFNAPLRGVTITKDPSTGVFTYVPNTVESRVFTPKMYLYPIPQGEINISPMLMQNPLW